MSITAYMHVQVCCDKCGDNHEGAVNQHFISSRVMKAEAKHLAERDGWKVRRRPHLCPDCRGRRR